MRPSTCLLFSRFGFVCFYVSFFFPLRVTFYCLLCFHTITLCVCVLRLSLQIKRLLTYLQQLGLYATITLVPRFANLLSKRSIKYGVTGSIRVRDRVTVSFYPNVTTLRSGLCCRKSVCLSSVVCLSVCNVGAPYSGG